MTLREPIFALALAAAALTGCATAEPDPEAAEPAITESAHSLRGTDTDGRLSLDRDGRFVLDADAVRLFDYFLTTEGEIDDAARRALVAREAQKTGYSAESVMAWYDAYCEYRLRFDAAIAKAGPAAELDDVLARVREARDETVGAHPLFAEDDALVEQAIAMKRAMAEQGPEAARMMQVAVVFAHQTEADVDAARAAHAPNALRQAEAHLRTQGASAAEVRALRVAKVGEAAADRLAKLDAQRAAWQARIDAAASALDALDPADEAGREALLAARFDAREIKRARTLLGAR